MNPFVRKARLAKALSELRKFSGQDTFLVEKVPDAQDTVSRKGTILPPGSTHPDAIVNNFCTPGETVETISHLATKFTGVNDVMLANATPMIIIPDSADSKDSNGQNMIDCPISAKSKRLNGMGSPVKGRYKWTVTDDLTAGSVSPKAETPMHIVLISHPLINPSSVATEVVSTAMNSLPTIELSRAQPYLNIEFLSSETSADAVAKGRTKGITTSRFLLGDSPPDAYEGFASAPFFNKANQEGEGQNEVTRSTYSGMDVFTMPQTLTRASPVANDFLQHNDPTNPVDPFRPFLSIESFGLTVGSPPVGTDALGCSVTANLSLILHDRKRLVDIAPLVTPGGFAKGDILRISYGYAHPDGQLVTVPSQAQRFSTSFGHVIDGMRNTELFAVSSADFSMTEAGEMKIDMTAFSIGAESGFSSIDVTDAFGDHVSFVT